MTQSLPEDNSELLEYLERTASFLRSRNMTESARRLELAARHANGSPSEFLHEAQMALLYLLDTQPVGVDVSEVRLVITRIQAAFLHVGGA